MYYKIQDFLNDWKVESNLTLKIFGNLTDESLTKKINENVRTAGRLAWHITISVGEMAQAAGLTFKTVEGNSPVPPTAKEIFNAYKEAADNFAEVIKANWNDDSLNIVDEMYGEKWKRGTTLRVIILHQIHHRGQLTIIMRLNGLVVPGVYGPAKEEWAQMGMTALE